MARKLGTYPLSSNIEIEAGAPLDARTIVPLKADLTRAGSFSYPYVGMEVFVTEELQKYRLIGTNPELTDNWTKTDKGVVDGYYDAEHGGFYKDQGFTKPITGTSEVLYIDKSTDNVYRWNGSAFAQINPIDSQVPTIDMADERENIAQNDDVATIMGKIAKYFDDLGEVAFSDDYDDLDNTPTKLSEFENDPGYITDEGIVTSVKVGNTSYDPVEGVVSLPQYPDISGKADKATTLAGYGITDAKIANGTITLGANTITPVTDISGKADKATTLAGYGITDAKIANGTITLGSNTITPLTQHQDISGKADKATTLAGYGITDAKIASGTITLGANTITPLTQHQDISGKADKATTLAGYGITDAKIASGTITLGSNTITPLTQHQSVTDNNPTLSWGTKSKVATIGSTAINVTMPSNPNTDTKVTSVGNHYAPAEDSTAQLDADASSSTAATWNSTSLVTGVTVKRDAKGHVTGLAVDSIKMPANPNTNTTYTFTGGTNKFTVTPSGGTAQDIIITPSITNNITGSGTSGYLAKFRGTSTITSGPQLGSSTTTYLRNDGSWATPPDNNTTYTIDTGDGNGQIKVTPSSGSAYNVSVKGIPTKTSQLTNDSGYITSSGSCASATSSSYISAFRATIASTSDLDVLCGDGIKYANVNANIASNYGDGLVVAIPWSGNPNYAHQLYFDDTSYVCGHRSLNNGTWSDWKKFIDESNYTDYTVKKDGTGASGTWGISISGSADGVKQTATTVNTYTHYEVLLSGTNDNTTRTEQTRKTNRLTFDPYMAMLTIGEPKSSSGNGMTGRVYLHEFGSTAKWSISPTAGGDDGETYSISLPVEDGTVLVQTDLGEAHLYDSTGLANSTKIPTGADVIGYLVNKHYARVGSSTVSKTTDQYGQFSLSVSNGYIIACGVDYRYWVMRHGETSFRLMNQGTYSIKASTTVTVWYIYVIYSS